VTDYRLPFAPQVQRHQRQRQWLIDLQNLLDPTIPPTTTATITQAVKGYLGRLSRWAKTEADPIDQQVVTHINRIFQSFWWGLFVCYDIDELPATNNELERFIRQIKAGQRRISGHKKVHDFVIRYGAFAAFVDHLEDEPQLQKRLHTVPYKAFLDQRQTLNLSLTREQIVFRFRHRRTTFLSDLEQRWSSYFFSDQFINSSILYVNFSPTVFFGVGNVDQDCEPISWPVARQYRPVVRLP